MRIGFIVGRTEEEYYDMINLTKVTPKKYLIDDRYLMVDVAIAMITKLTYPNITVDIILPHEVTQARLQKNYVNFPIGYDIINANLGDPYVKKFSTKKGIQNLENIYKNKKSKIFPPYEHLDFIWNKDKYMNHMLKKYIPITPSIIIDKININKLIQDIKKNKWKKFILKPIGSTSKEGFKLFTLNNILKNKKPLEEYLQENKYYSKFIVQEFISGFGKFGEIRIYWINEEYSYAANTKDMGEEYNMMVNPVKDKKRLDTCIEIGKKVIENIPKIKINGHIVKPVMNRTDFACCLNNDKISSYKYYLNEIEHQDAGTFTNTPFNEKIKYPITTILADAFIKKAHELKSINF
tara:strand:- start:62 stop:1114 length:1053 start_codon:yes stop_codon:yes gene_type:complete